jgi:hypothetical protein
VHTLCLREDEQDGDYYLAAGSPHDYLKAVKIANAELDHLAARPDYQTPLGFQPEPVRYRQTGFDIHRYRVPPVLDRSPAGRGQPQGLPPLGLAGSSFLVMMLQAGEEPALNAEGRPGTGQVRMKVMNPQGQVVVDQPTDQYVRSAKLAVPTNGESGLWSLKLERMPGQGFRALGLTFDKALPPVVSLVPGHVFTRR